MLGSKFQVEDITLKMSSNTQVLLEPRILSTVREYLEERPYKKTIKSVVQRVLKKLAVKYSYKLVMETLPRAWVDSLFYARYGISGGGLLQRWFGAVEMWKQELYLHCIAPCFYVGFIVDEEDLEKGYIRLSNLIECELGPEVVKGSINGAIQIQMAKLDESKPTKYALVAYLHTTRASKLNHPLVFKEGAAPKELKP
jgi:hypothetical protein